MKSFWQESYDGDKDRRYGLLFFAALLASPLAVALGALVYAIAGADTFPKFILPALPGIGFLLTALIWRAVRRARRNRSIRLKYASLSREEMLKARSKLKNGWKPVKPPAPRAPDTDLKY